MGFTPYGVQTFSALTVTGALTAGSAAVTGALSSASLSVNSEPLLQLQAATPVTGTALTAGTPNILQWTTPNDGNMHRFITFGNTIVSSSETGGQVGTVYTPPTGVSHTGNNDSGTNGAGTIGWQVLDGVAKPNTTVTIQQLTAVSGGAAAVVCEIWGA